MSCGVTEVAVLRTLFKNRTTPVPVLEDTFTTMNFVVGIVDVCWFARVGAVDQRIAQAAVPFLTGRADVGRVLAYTVMFENMDHTAPVLVHRNAD